MMEMLKSVKSVKTANFSVDGRLVIIQFLKGTSIKSEGQTKRESFIYCSSRPKQFSILRNRGGQTIWNNPHRGSKIAL